MSRKPSDRGVILRLAAHDTKLADAKKIASPRKASFVSAGTGTVIGDRTYWVGEDRIYATVIDGGPEEIRISDHDGKELGNVPTPPVASVSYLVPLGGNSILYNVQTYVAPPAWYRYNGTGEPRPRRFAPPHLSILMTLKFAAPSRNQKMERRFRSRS